MKRIAMLSAAILLTAGVAVAGEAVIQSEKNVEEKATHSTTVQDNDDMDGNMTTRKKVEMEKKRSKTTTESNDEGLPGATQEYQHQSETYHQHSTKEVEKK